MTTDLHPDSLLDFQPTAATALEAILFEIDPVWFAIPLNRVDRIVDIANIHNDFSDLSRVELLDLQELLFDTCLAEPKAWAICHNVSGSSYGIPIGAVPTIVSIPYDRIRQLPRDVRTTSPLGIASHVASIAEFDRELTVFMLVD
jgi:chemotaxis signal transduction protein